jgi:hypothetical protein
MTATIESRPLVGALNLYLIRREFDGAGVVRHPGEIVDASEWPNAERLVATGYLIAFNGSVVEKGGRMWRNTDIANKFLPQSRRKTSPKE